MSSERASEYISAGLGEAAGAEAHRWEGPWVHGGAGRGGVCSHAADCSVVGKREEDLKHLLCWLEMACFVDQGHLK